MTKWGVECRDDKRERVVEMTKESSVIKKKGGKMMRNWRTVVKIVVALLSALLGAVGAAASGVQI
jgi:hypothetical protein